MSIPAMSPGHLLWRVTETWQRGVRSALAPHGLLHEEFVLLAGAWWLSGHGGPSTVARLAHHTAVDPAETATVVAGLRAAGLVEMAETVVLTAAGLDRLRRAMPDVHAADERFFAPVPADETVAVLARLLGEGDPA